MRVDKGTGKVKLGNRLVGEREPCFIIAEAGVNHNGDISLAIKLIDAAAAAGADAVKFQTFRAEDVVTADAEKADYQKETAGTGESQFQMLKNLELNRNDFQKLFDYARKKGIIFLSSPFDNEGVDLLEGLGVPAFKIPSGEITNYPLLKYIVAKNKPLILSTGMATLKEVKEALDVIKSRDIILLHCVSSYPARIEDTNLKAMETLKNTFRLPVGMSDHSKGITVPVAAAALGACVIEKHFTLGRSLPGPDHKASLEPDELKQMVEAIRDVEKAMGDGLKQPAEKEEEIIKVSRRSIVAAVDIPGGTIITDEMLAIKRPGTGLEPKYLDKIIGGKTKVDIQRDELITFDMVSPP